MRALVSVLGAATLGAVGCSGTEDPGPGPDPGGGGGPQPTGRCMTSTDCTNGDVCGRDDNCWPQDQVRSVMTRWTVAGQPSDSTSCAPIMASHEMSIQYASTTTGASIGFAPLQCAEGQFLVDVWPIFYDHVDLTVFDPISGQPAYQAETDLGATGDQDVTVDLEPSP